MGNDVMIQANVLSVEYSALGAQLSATLNQIPFAEVVEQLDRDTCYICGSEFTVYAANKHHIENRGSGGSGLRDVDTNQALICNICHNQIHGKGVLRFYRDTEDLKLWYEKMVDGEWIKRVPYGRFKKSELLGDTLNIAQSFSGWLNQQRKEMSMWDDRALVEKYHIAETTGSLLFATQCQIIHILSARRELVNGTSSKRVGMEDTAKLLGISYPTARLRHAVYVSIFSKVPEEQTWTFLTPEFFYAAYRSKSFFDPIEALNQGEERRLSNRNYSASQFKEDILMGFPDGERNTPATCPYTCKHCQRTDADTTMTLYRQGVILGSGAAEGIWYCAVKKKLAHDLGPSETCEELTAR